MTMLASDSDRYVLLSGGLSVPVAPLLLVFELEERGFRLTRAGDELIVRPGPRLTDVDCQRIRRWKAHILALLDYQPPEVH
jgi:hypothetical protein